MRILRVIGVAALLSAPAMGIGAAATDQNPLKKKLALETQAATPVAYLAVLLRQADTAGGIEDFEAGCGADPQIQMPALEGTLGDGLARVKQHVSGIRWEVLDEGLVVSKGSPVPSVLDTKIDQFSFNLNDPPNRITSDLLNSEALVNFISRQGFTVGSPELGFSQAKTEPGRKVVLHNASVRQILNSIATTSHPRVWLYQQRNCNGRKTLTINWVVK